VCVHIYIHILILGRRNWRGGCGKLR